jgi:hypothetical protein
LLPEGWGITAEFRVPRTARDSFRIKGVFPSHEAARGGIDVVVSAYRIPWE